MKKKEPSFRIEIAVSKPKEGNMSSDVPIIHKTRDYDKFTLIDTNRTITNNRSLRNAIVKCNKLKFHPIVVNSNYQITDGQHRWNIAKELGIDLYYVIDPSPNVEDIQMMNIGNKNWTTDNHIEFFMKQDYEAYKNIMMYKEITGLNTTLIITTFAKRPRGLKYDHFREGKMEMKFTHEKALQYAEAIGMIVDYVRKIEGRKGVRIQFYYALAKFVVTENPNPVQFIKKLAAKPDILYTCVTMMVTNNIYQKLKKIDQTIISERKSRKRVA